MARRFVDRQDSEDIIHSTDDFHIRAHHNFVLWTTYAFIAGVLVILLLVKYVLGAIFELTEMQSLPTAEIILTVAFILMVMLSLDLYVYLIVKKMNNIALKNEFQNLLFSSAMKVHSLFSFIIKDNYDLIYADNRSQNVFQSQNIESLDALLKHKGLKKEHKAMLEDAFKNKKSIEVPFTYKDDDGKSHNAIIVVDPLERPAGYFVIRGY